MNLQPTRRQMLMAAACSVMAAQASATLIPSTPKTARQLASWDDGALRCWFEGQAAAVPQVVADAQAIWGDRAVFQHLDANDLQAVLGLNHAGRLPTLGVSCRTSQNIFAAAEAAFQKAMARGTQSDNAAICGVLVLVSTRDQSSLIANMTDLGRWAKTCLSVHTLWAWQALCDESLASGCKRVSVVIAKGVGLIQPRSGS